MGLLDPTRDIQRQSMKGMEVEGYVINVDDPDKRQRVRIRVPVLHRDVPDDKLPWANQRGMNQANAGAGVGSAAVPDKNAKVAVKFLNDDPHDPQYGPSPTSDDVNKDNELLNEDYPNTVGNVDSFGNRWSTNKATGDVTFVHKSGSSTTYDGAGNVSHTSAGDMSFASKGKISFSANGDVSMSSKGVASVMGTTSIELNTAGATSPTVPGARATPQIPDRSGQTSL